MYVNSEGADPTLNHAVPISGHAFSPPTMALYEPVADMTRRKRKRGRRRTSPPAVAAEVETRWGSESVAQDLRLVKSGPRSGGRNTAETGLHACPECHYTTKRRTNLARHRQAMHSRDKRLECCGALYRSKSELRRHVRRQHGAGYACALCARLFCRKALLKRHMSVHNGVKEFVCGLCPYASSHKSNLERHQRVHWRPGLDLGDPAALEPPRELVVPARRQRKRGVSAAAAVPRLGKIASRLKGLYRRDAMLQDAKAAVGGAPLPLPLPHGAGLNARRLFAKPYKCLQCNQRWHSQVALSRHERASHPDLEVRALMSLPIKRVLQLIRRAR